jgi:transketolase
MIEVKELERKAVEVRRRTVEIIYNASGGHIGGSLSSVDILVALHFGIMSINPENPEMKGRDRFILSKGHSVGVGLALAAKRSGESYRTYVLMGDGEHGEGSIMEAAASAGQFGREKFSSDLRSDR